ncbi:DNA polymerase delta catalytic subunit [Gracilariopsis chorda]|uniref:DNA polymerase n=1 Tax=Gracilariopsis chorda TaxID=448386 RepID=A0A2V3ISM5_9FLOR|nr:DNA polymerase delta catalytic subunit [Gracilariopsis chorda]|eukprot:PXF45121.1 DNA polymerase delta catalytic subunit [Gracilariopsis chorda]
MGASDLQTVKVRDVWRRPPLPNLNPQADPLVVMQVDVSDDHATEGNGSAILRLFGVTEQGNSVLLRVHRFYHYFYVPVLPGVEASALNEALNVALSKKHEGMSHRIVVHVRVVTKRNIMYFVPGDPEMQFFRITILNPRYMKETASLLQSGGLRVETPDGLKPLPELLTFESTLDYALRFMIETGLMGCSWLTVPASKYKLVPHGQRESHLQIEVDVDADDIISHKPEGKWLTTAPLRRLSFDIECAGRKGIFPEPQHDSVIQIANYVWDHGQPKPIAKVVFTLKSCASIVGADVLSFEDESSMLSAWREFVRVTDPDILTGYNIVNFDLPYLLDRAKELAANDFPFLGRLRRAKTTMRKTRMSSSAFGTHESRSFSLHGRTVFDMLQLITREYKLRSYSLNSVSAEFLGQQKEDVHYSIISDLQNGDEQTRRRLAVYCLKDALLPVKLMDKLLALTNYMEMSRVTGIPLGWLVSRGHMIKVVSLLHRKSHQVDLLVPDLKRNMGEAGASDGPQFEGATVIEPMKGYYRDPIATLDFASLYPSIIMAHNLCYSTLIRPLHLSHMNSSDYTTSPSGSHFVKKTVKKGILTKILEELLAARKKAKKDLKEAEDPFLKSVLNGRQLALKISANAVYGFTGASVGKLPCMDISASTTAYGRQMIESTKAEVEKRYKHATVIYGDTDSVMIKFGSSTSLEESMRLGEEAATAISEVFPKPVKLEFEKCYYPYLLISKKRYAGLLWTNTKDFDKMDCKGVESVRRDNCRLVANVISTSLELLLKKQDLQKAIDTVKQTISDLLQNKIDISLLVVSKALTKTDYEAKQAHVTLAEKMRKRDAGTAPSLGDRVPYVITHGSKNEPAYSRAEDPLYVLEHNVPIDNRYYLENMLRKPLERIFEPVMGTKVGSLFVGEHTRTVSVVTSKKGALMKFAKIRLSCLGCKSPVNEGAICKYCVPKEAEIYMKHLDSVTKLEKVYASLWTECQRCMGDVCHDVLCSNGDCPIFYRRRKAQKDLDYASEKLQRFELDW